MYLSLNSPKEFETLGLNINSPYFQALSLQAKNHVRAELYKWLTILSPLTISTLPSLESFWILDISLEPALSPWNITLQWNSHGIILEDDKDLTLFSALVDNLSPKERRSLNLFLMGETVEVSLEIARNHTGRDRRLPYPPSPENYPFVQAFGRITIKLPKETKDFLTGLGKIKEITEVQTETRLFCKA
jgi:hypothetical protein